MNLFLGDGFALVPSAQLNPYFPFSKLDGWQKTSFNCRTFSSTRKENPQQFSPQAPLLLATFSTHIIPLGVKIYLDPLSRYIYSQPLKSLVFFLGKCCKTRWIFTSFSLLLLFFSWIIEEKIALFSCSFFFL